MTELRYAERPEYDIYTSSGRHVDRLPAWSGAQALDLAILAHGEGAYAVAASPQPSHPTPRERTRRRS